MSVIGTTLKQPRVFAHDAVSLIDLPGCIYAGVKGFDLLTGQGDPGTGFEENECYQTYNETTGGYGAIVQVTSVDANGEITGLEVCTCGEGTMYSVGDILTIIWNETGGSTSGTNSTGFVSVDGITFEEWSWGCPFSPMENRILTQDEIDAASGIVGYEAKPPTLLQKEIVTWNCGNEEPPSCPEATFNPGASLYIGREIGSLEVIMESGNKAVYRNIAAGTFMPISCLSICAVTTAGAEPEPIQDPAEAQILVLF